MALLLAAAVCNAVLRHEKSSTTTSDFIYAQHIANRNVLTAARVMQGRGAWISCGEIYKMRMNWIFEVRRHVWLAVWGQYLCMHW